MKKKFLTAVLAVLVMTNAITASTFADYDKTERNYVTYERDGFSYCETEGIVRCYNKEKRLTILDYTNASEEDGKNCKKFFELFKNGADKEEIERYYNYWLSDEGGMSETLCFTDEQITFLNDGVNRIIKIDFTPVDHTKFSLTKDWERESNVLFEFYTDKYRAIEKRYPLDERNTFTTKEIRSESMIAADESIYQGIALVTYFFNTINSIDLYPCTEGWNTIDSDKYYVKSDGTLATKSMTIDGVRYKFAKSGVCEGKYTGWTKSSRGKRYWKNGELLKNKTLRTKSGKVYRIDRNGYAAVKVS